MQGEHSNNMSVFPRVRRILLLVSIYSMNSKWTNVLYKIEIVTHDFCTSAEPRVTVSFYYETSFFERFVMQI